MFLPIVVAGQSNLTQNYYQLSSSIPPQVSSLAEYKSLTAAGDAIGQGASYLFWAFIFVGIFFSFVLGMLWGAFQTLQIILAMPLLFTKMPANVIVVFRGFTDIVNMNVIDK